MWLVTVLKLQILLAREQVKKYAGFSYDNSVSLQTNDTGQVGAAVLAYVVVTERD